MRRFSKIPSLLRVILVASIAVLAAAWAFAYEDYSTNQPDHCAACHGDFQASSYQELAPDGEIWPEGLHETHETMVNGDCNVCHQQGGRFPVILDSSRGGASLSPISCVGCHRGAAQRQHHFRVGVSCLSCHSDSDPANFTPPGEDVLPTYYAEDPGIVHENMPTDPCNPAPDYVEDFAGVVGRGIDNDGDLVYDMDDTDCSGVVTPGEASGPTLNPLMVTDVDRLGQTLSLSYDPPCMTLDHCLVVGTLTSPFTYAYSGATQCSIGTSGTYTWDFSTLPGDVFFLISANDYTFEGPYGQATSGVERPQDPTCTFSQSLPDRCD